MAWDDTPPTKEELSGSWMDKPPTPEELGQKPQTSLTESALRGAGQGLSFGFADELTGGAEALWKAAKGDPKTFGELYRQARDESRTNYKNAEESNPKTYMAGQVGGAIAPALLSGGETAIASGAKALGGAATSVPAFLAQGAAQGLGNSDADLTKGDIGQAAKDTAMGGLIGGVTAGAGNLLSKIPAAAGNFAEKAALNATGATGMQSSRFAPGAGRELLDRGLVKFGDAPADIAERLGTAHEAAGQAIGDALSKLDAQGGRVSVVNIVQNLENKINELSQTAGNEKVIAQIQSQIDNIVDRGQGAIPFSSAEQAKRNFQGQVNYNSPVAEQKGVFHTADAYKNEAERAAQDLDPSIAKNFQEEKKTFGLLAPIKEAAVRRANVLNQHSVGGLLDTAASAGGALLDAANPIGGAAALAATRRLIAPRISSSAAVLSDIVSKSPQMLGKFGPVLQSAAQRGANSLGVTDYLLQSNNPEYREMKKQLDGDQSE